VITLAQSAVHTYGGLPDPGRLLDQPARRVAHVVIIRACTNDGWGKPTDIHHALRVHARRKSALWGGTRTKSRYRNKRGNSETGHTTILNGATFWRSPHLFNSLQHSSDLRDCDM